MIVITANTANLILLYNSVYPVWSGDTIVNLQYVVKNREYSKNLLLEKHSITDTFQTFSFTGVTSGESLSASTIEISKGIDLIANFYKVTASTQSISSMTSSFVELFKVK